MAGLVSLIFRGGLASVVVVGLGCFSTAVEAEAPTQLTPTAPKPAPVKVVTAKPAVNPAPVDPALQQSLDRYGKILLPGDEQSHPLKLDLPFPGAGEVKVPTAEEMTKRVKLEELAKLSDDEIRAQLDQWPAYSKMTLRAQAQLLFRIQDFRDYRARTALQKAHDLGLLTLTPDQKTRFEKEYWDQRLKMDQELVKQLGPIFNAREQKLEDVLYREFSTAPGSIALGPKPPVLPAPAAPVKSENPDSSATTPAQK